MHSRIFEFRKEPFTDEEEYKSFMEEEPSSSVPIADYIVDSEERESDIEWVIKHLDIAGVSLEFDSKKETILFKDGFKETYFSKKFQALKNLMSDLTLEIFSGSSEDSSFDLFLIQKELNDKYGFWVYKDEFCYTLDEFIRYAESDTIYYIGGVGDFHF